MAGDWRVLAQRVIPGQHPDSWPFIDTDLPVTDLRITDALSGPTQIAGHIDPVYRRLKAADGQPVLNEWGTCLWAEASGQIRGGGIYMNGAFDGPRWSVTGVGFAGYPKGMGYQGSTSFVQADPLDVVRHIWAHLQAGQDSNLGMAVDDSTRTPVRIGTASGQVEFTTGSGDQVSFASDDGPYELNDWSTDDLGSVIDNLARTTPFDYRERHAWNGPKTAIRHSLEFGYPKLGQRRHNLRFVIGENIHTLPTATRDGGSFANHVRFLGAGEGRDMVRREARLSDGRLRRMATVDDKSVLYGEHAQRRAREELTRRQPLLNVAEVVVRDSTMAPVGSWEPGDEIRLQGELDWVELDLWMRVLSITITPDTPEVVSMSLLRADLA